MASFAPIRGTRAQIQATPIVDGQFLIETDQGVDNMIYIDEGSTRTIVGGNTISGVLPELYIYSETGSVVTVEDAGGNVIPTSQVGTDHWTCELPDYGVYTVTSVLSGETTTQSIDVNDCMIYTIDASHFHVNIVVTYPSGVGASCQISGGGETYSAPALNPPNTSYKFVVHGKNTTYTITTTVDGATKTATVTSGTTIDQTYEVTMSYGQINLTVETPPITGDITCTDGVTTIIKPASANMVFYVPNTGTWDISGSDGSITYSTRAIVTSLSTPVSTGLNTGLDLSAWITAGSTTEYPLNPSSYADFSALEADEAAIRQLMLVHDSVDYLATAPAGDNLMQNVINSDICAKWINLSDYALDTLSANSDIASEMSTADKYGYGEWGLVGQVPNMTSAPASGVVEASSDMSGRPGWYVFNDSYKLQDDQGWVANDSGAQSLTYTFPEPICIRRAKIVPLYTAQGGHYNRTRHYKYQAYNGSEWIDISDEFTFNASDFFEREDILSVNGVENTNKYTKYKLYIFADGRSVTVGCNHLQFLAYAPLGNVPIMTSNNAPYGEAFASDNTYAASHPIWHAFDGNANTIAAVVNGIGSYIGFHFVNPMKLKKVRFVGSTPPIADTFGIQGSNDNSTWSNDLATFTADTSSVDVDVDSDTYYLYYRVVQKTKVSTNNGTAFTTLQFYGRELKPLVPTMTSNTTPKGECIANSASGEYYAYNAFNGKTPSVSNRWTPVGGNPTDITWLGYTFEESVCVKALNIYPLGINLTNVIFEADNNGFASGASVVTIGSPFTPTDMKNNVYLFNNDDNFTSYRVRKVASIGTLQFYGHNYSEKEFATGSTAKWIYDHGVEANGVVSIENATKLNDCIRITSANGYCSQVIDTTSYTYMGGKAGLHASGTNRLLCGSATSNFTSANMPDSNGMDITNVNGSNTVAVTQTASGTFDVKEVWLE